MTNSYKILYLKGLEIKYDYSSNNQMEDMMKMSYMKKIRSLQ